MGLFDKLSQAGVEVCTADDGKVHNMTTMSQTATLLESVIKMQLGNEESAKKSKRVKEAWQAKRADTRTPMTTRAPVGCDGQARNSNRYPSGLAWSGKSTN